MLGVVLAGGSGSRLYPLTKSINKHLLPVQGVPMIHHPIMNLIYAGIKEIVIVTGVDHMGQIVDQLGSGKAFGVDFTYKVQDQAGGIAEALGLVRGMKPKSMAVVLGDNIFSQNYAFSTHFNAFRLDAEYRHSGCHLFLKEVNDPERFGVAVIGEDNKVKIIEEKPHRPKTNLCVTGMYLYDERVFDFIDSISPSSRNELEITDVNNMYAARGDARYTVLDCFWSDAGTMESYKYVNNI